MKNLIIFCLTSLFVVSCNSRGGEPLEISGLSCAHTKGNPGEVYQKAIDLLKSKAAISIIAEVNHGENAKKVESDIGFVRIVFFGNPKVGTPIMQKNLQAGLDLPQKIVIFSHADKEITAIYNSVSYLCKRHGVDGVETISKMSGALSKITKGFMGNEPKIYDTNVKLNEGIVEKESKYNVEKTYNNIKSIIEKNPKISVMGELDHQANAAKVGLKLSPCKIIIFGNPQVGTPFMKEKRTVGIDLPQKMLVYQNKEGKTIIVYNDPAFLAKRHGVSQNLEIIKKMTKALAKIAEKASE